MKVSSYENKTHQSKEGRLILTLFSLECGLDNWCIIFLCKWCNENSCHLLREIFDLHSTLLKPRSKIYRCMLNLLYWKSLLTNCFHRTIFFSPPLPYNGLPVLLQLSRICNLQKYQVCLHSYYSPSLDWGWYSC